MERISSEVVEWTLTRHQRFWSTFERSPRGRRLIGLVGGSVPARAAVKATLVARILALRWALPSEVAARPLPELLERLTPSDVVVAASSTTGTVEQLAWWLLRGSRVGRTTCLYRALVRYALLREAGLDVRFVMGVRHEADDLIGHAWLEHDERPFGEELKGEYRATFEHPRRDA